MTELSIHKRSTRSLGPGSTWLLRAYLLLTCLLAGLLANVGLAIYASIAFEPPVIREPPLKTNEPMIAWPGVVPSNWPTTPMSLGTSYPFAMEPFDEKPMGAMLKRGHGRWRDALEISVTRSHGSINYLYTIEEFGYPWRSLRRDWTMTVGLRHDDAPDASPVEGWHGGLGKASFHPWSKQSLAQWMFRSNGRAPSSTATPEAFVPVRPVAQGFILNTMLYFAIASVLVFGLARMLRRYARVLLWMYIVLTCAGLGLAANIGVAMLCAFRAPDTTAIPPVPIVLTAGSTIAGPNARWPGPVPEDWPDTPMSPHKESSPSDRERLDLPYVTQASNYWQDDTRISIDRRTGGTSYTYIMRRFGFPWRSLRRDFGESTDMAATPGLWRAPVPGLHGGLGFYADYSGGPLITPDSPIPVLPVWPGFIGNTLLYSLLAAALIAGPVWLIHRRRVHAGECVRCRYPVTGLPICPECGTPAGVSAADRSKATPSNPVPANAVQNP